MIFDIPVFNYEPLVERIVQLNRRASKLGCAPITLRIVREYQVERKTNTGVKYKQSRCEVEMLGETPKFEGWSLFAAVERQENGENLVRNVPGRVVPERFRTTDTHCDHCGVSRNRKEVFVLGHEDGRFAQVGRQCIADFLGHVSAENLAAQATWMCLAHDVCCDSGEDDYSGRGGGELRRDIREYLATVAIVVRRLGWLSNTTAREHGYEEQSTSSISWQLVTCNDRWTREFIEEKGLKAEERDEKLAEEALKWARERQGASDYEYNLGVACRQEVVTYKRAGLVASAISAYLREVERQEELRQPRKESRHVGEIDKRTDFKELTVQRLRHFEGQYGVKTLVAFEDRDGNRLIWWASKEQDLAEGDVVDIRGTVSKHSEYNGVLQTELKRVQIQESRSKTS